METSKGELVPGGLAMIVGSSGRHPETVGMVVELTHKVEWRDLTGWHWVGCPALFTQSRFLIPINPEADPLDVEEEQCQTA